MKRTNTQQLLTILTLTSLVVIFVLVGYYIYRRVTGGMYGPAFFNLKSGRMVFGFYFNMYDLRDMEYIKNAYLESNRILGAASLFSLLSCFSMILSGLVGTKSVCMGSNRRPVGHLLPYGIACVVLGFFSLLLFYPDGIRLTRWLEAQAATLPPMSPALEDAGILTSLFLFIGTAYFFKMGRFRLAIGLLIPAVLLLGISLHWIPWLRTMPKSVPANPPNDIPIP